MALTTIFEEQTVEGFVDVSEVGTGPWIADGIDATSPIVVGETYLMLWDDAEYECVADEMEMDGGVTIPYIGNPSWYGAEDNGLPFLVGYGSPEATGSTAMYIIITDDSGTSHTVGIYQVTSDDDTGGDDTGGTTEEEHIVLKDRNGNDITYQGINMIKLKTTGGGTKTFAACDDVEKTVAPDFSNGDVEVLPDTGTLLSKVTIEKPETLLPENVRNGVEVAGVTGEFIGDTEEATVELALANENQVVSPSADGKVISKVTIVKPETLVPENIAKDVDIAGVVGTAVTATETQEVELDFSEGNQVVLPSSEDVTISQVTITKPETLVPENIAEGIDVAGIIGTLAASGGGGGDGAYCEYTLDNEGYITHAKMYNFTAVPPYFFNGLSRLQSVDWSNSPDMTSIGDYAFNGCKSLTEIIIPDSVISIGNNAFRNCTALASVTIGSGVTSIGDHAFNACSSLTEIIIPDSVTSIGQYAFYTCTKLASVTIGSGVTSIGDCAFYSISLTEIIIPDSVTSIGGSAFYTCTKLASVTIGSGVTSIGRYAFYGCSVLTSAIFKDTTTWYVGSSAGATSSQVAVTDTSKAATLLRSTYYSQYWTKT